MNAFDESSNLFSIIVISNKDNKEYLKFKIFVDQNINTIKQKNIGIHEQLGGGNSFMIYIYKSMRLVDNINNFNEKFIKEFINSINSQKISNHNQSGGTIDYKQKYLKYKNKYNSIKKVCYTLV